MKKIIILAAVLLIVLCASVSLAEQTAEEALAVSAVPTSAERTSHGRWVHTEDSVSLVYEFFSDGSLTISAYDEAGGEVFCLPGVYKVTGNRMESWYIWYGGEPEHADFEISLSGNTLTLGGVDYILEGSEGGKAEDGDPAADETGLEGRWKLMDSGNVLYYMPRQTNVYMIFRAGILTIEEEDGDETVSEEIGYRVEGDRIILEEQPGGQIAGEMTFQVEGDLLSLTMDGYTVLLRRQ